MIPVNPKSEEDVTKMANLFTVNHKEAGGTFEALPIQEYEVIVSQVKLGKSKGDKTNGCEQLELQLTIRQDIEQPGQKRKFFDNIIFAVNLNWKIQQFFKACNFPDGTTFESTADIAKAVAYRSLRVKNKHEIYQDTPKDKVDFYTVSQSPMDPAAAGGMAGGTTFDPFADENGTSATPPVNDDDDVPF